MHLDGNMVDMATISVGAAAALLSPCKRWMGNKKPLFLRENAIADMLNGSCWCRSS